MKKPSLLSALCAIASYSLLTYTAQAAILFDNSPQASGYPLFTSSESMALQNEYSDASWIAPAVFDQDVVLTGMDIFTSDSIASPGQLARILIYLSPFAPPVYNFTESLTGLTSVTVTGDSQNDIAIAHVDFSTPIPMQANTLFAIGMSGANANLGLYGLDTGGDPNQAMLVVDNGTLTLTPHIDHIGMAFRLHGNIKPVPDFGPTAGLFALAIFVVVMGGRRLFPR